MYKLTHILMYISVALSLAAFVLKIILSKQRPSNNYLPAIIIQLFSRKVETSN